MFFDRFEIRPAQRLLLQDGQPLELGARAFDLLLVLAEQAGALVSKDTLLERVWPGVVVEEANLHVQVSALRKLLGREAIATVPGRGYQFVRPVLAAPPAGAALAPQAGPAAGAVPGPAPGLAPGPEPGAGEAPAGALPPLLGRARELQQLCTWLQQPVQVTVTGAGGSGKTLLARHAVQALQPGLPRPAAWVDLLELDDPAAVPAAVAAALGYAPGAASAAALARALALAPCLLVLDNAEHLLDAVRALVQVLREGAPGLRLLVTSQASLRLPGEQRLALRGLAVPAWPCSLEAARASPAVALFAERARQADRRFRLSDATLPDVVAVCRALDGSALGLQLAAALLGMQPLEAVRQRLAPAAGAAVWPDAPPPAAPDNVLQAALGWSCGLLAEGPRRVFRRMAVALGPLPWPVLAEVAADDTLDATAVADALDELVDRSLAALEPAGAGRPSRLRLLDVPRSVALQQLRASGEEAGLRRRLAQALAGQARQARAAAGAGQGMADGSAGADIGPMIASPRVDVAAADVQQALAWALDHDIQAAALLAQLQASHQLPAELRMACSARLEASAAQDGLAPGDAGEALVAAAALTKHSNLGRRHALMLQAAAHFEAAGALRDRYYALARAGEAAASNRRVEAAEAALAQARALEDPAWPPGLRQVLAAGEAALASARGDHAAALAAFRQALALGRQHDGTAPLSLLVSVADVELTLGQADAAAAHLQEAAAQALQRGMLAERWSFVLANLAAACLMQGDLAGARQAAAEAWPHARLFDADPWWADHLAWLAASEGRPHTAALLLGLGDAGYARISDTRQPLEARHAALAAAAARQALGEGPFSALRRQGASPGMAAAVTQAALAPDDLRTALHSAPGTPPGEAT